MRSRCLFLVFCLLLFCPGFFFFLYIKALGCSSHIIEFTLLRCTIDWFLEYSQSCTTVTIINFRAFSLHPKESLTVLTSSHSVFPVLHLLQPQAITASLGISRFVFSRYFLYYNKRNHRICGLLQILYDITYMQNLKYNTDEPVFKTDSQTQRTDMWLSRGREGGRGKDQEFGISRFKL